MLKKKTVKPSLRRSSRSINTTTKKTKKYGLADLEKQEGALTLGSFLKSWRLSEDLTQSEFAKNIGISAANLCDIEKKRQLVSPEKAAEIAERIGYPPSVLVEIVLNEQLSLAGLKIKVKAEVA